MSGRSCTSGSVRSGAGSVRLPAPHGPHATHEVVLDALYERKRDNKSVRVLTVIIYVFCVSLAAIMLSLYYVFFWEPKDAQYAQRKVSHNVDQQTSTTPMPTCLVPHTGGSNFTMSEALTTPSEEPSLPTSNEPPDPDIPPGFMDPYNYNLTSPDGNETWPFLNRTNANVTDHR